MAWFDKTLQSFTHRNGRLIIQVISESSEVVLHGLPKSTDFLQPVDAGCAQKLKLVMSQEFYNWIEHAYHWYTNANTELYIALKRRVFISFWAAAALELLFQL